MVAATARTAAAVSAVQYGGSRRLLMLMLLLSLLAAAAAAAASHDSSSRQPAAAFLSPPSPSALLRSTRQQRQHQHARSSNIQMLLAYPKDVRPRLKVGDIVIPVAKTLQQPPQLVALGLYVGVEYRILGISVLQEPQEECDNQQLQEQQQQGEGGQPAAAAVAVTPVARLSALGEEELDRVRVTLKPRYRLTKRYDRPWPIEVAFSDLPYLLYPRMYNTVTLGATLGVSSFFLLAGAFGRAFVSFVYVPSLSMYPAIKSGDLIVVEGVSRHFFPLRRGDIVAFRPPPALKALISQRTQQPAPSLPPLGSGKGELFVKRVGCLQGDRVELTREGLLCQTPQGQRLEPPTVHTTVPSAAIASAVGGDPKSLMAPQELTVPAGFSYVVGDNPQVSIDSRVWGGVPQDHIVGRAIWRLLPLSRFGPLN